MWDSLPEWGILLAVIVYGVVKLALTYVQKANDKRTEAEVRAARKATVPPKPRGKTSYGSLKAMTDPTGEQAINRVLDEREREARAAEMQELVKKLVESDERDSKTLASLAQTAARQEAMLEHQGQVLEQLHVATQRVAEGQVRIMETWARQAEAEFVLGRTDPG